MKAIIKGRKYNTDTARLVARDSNDLGWRDYRYYIESLYRKKTGEFFLYGEGGPASKYRVRNGDCWDTGEQIIPLTNEKAREWIEQNCSVETYEELFGEVEE